MFVHRCMECVHRMCLCGTLSTAHRPQTGQEKYNNNIDIAALVCY